MSCGVLHGGDVSGVFLCGGDRGSAIGYKRERMALWGSNSASSGSKNSDRYGKHRFERRQHLLVLGAGGCRDGGVNVVIVLTAWSSNRKRFGDLAMAVVKGAWER
ncbi:hypothetical protein OROGR_005784 [Orobanche gracilis]